MFAVLDAVGATSVVVVGYSMSGRWAQWMACSQPERVHGMVLIAPVPAADIPFPDELKAQWLQVARERRIETFAPWVHQFTKAPLGTAALDSYFESVTSTAELSLGATLDMCRQQGQFIDRFSATRARTLVIGGLADPMLPPGVLREAVVAPIPGARLVALDCGHEIRWSSRRRRRRCSRPSWPGWGHQHKRRPCRQWTADRPAGHRLRRRVRRYSKC
jgi:pimeloyl-ACP methyl ester carboxylesterase